MSDIPPPVFSRRSFLFFILLAPACILAVAGIVLTLQYKQYRLLVAPAALVETPVSDAFALSSQGRADSLLNLLGAFSSGAGPDTVNLSPDDLNALAAASPVLGKDGIRIRFTGTDSLLVVESSRRVDALTGRLAWIFKRIAHIRDGWLNARMEGLPELKAGQLAFAPERGFMNGSKVPRAAMTKRAGMSPRDFIEPSAEPAYKALLAALDTVFWKGRAVRLVRGTSEE